MGTLQCPTSHSGSLDRTEAELGLCKLKKPRVHVGTKARKIATPWYLYFDKCLMLKGSLMHLLQRANRRALQSFCDRSFIKLMRQPSGKEISAFHEVGLPELIDRGGWGQGSIIASKAALLLFRDPSLYGFPLLLCTESSRQKKELKSQFSHQVMHVALNTLQ